ncbi:MAG: hypothetical protein ACYS0K_24095 [Planctomycetota bacterium]|jgi:hypothetical protein
MMRITCTLLLLCAFARAEISVKNSLEWMVIESDLIVRGRIASIEPLAQKGESVWETVRFKVEETLKGERRESVSFVVCHDARQESFVRKTRPKGVEMLCFLVKSERLDEVDDVEAKEPWALHNLQEVESLLHLEGDRVFWTFDRSGKEYDGREGILGAVRRAIRTMPTGKRPKSAVVEYPILPDPVPLAGPDYLVVPIDHHLESLAQKMLAVKDEKYRIKGVKILRHFKSERNIELLKGLLNSEAVSRTVENPFRHTVIGESPGWRVYWLRAEAWRVLRSWGVKVNRPVLLEPWPDGE